MAPEKKNIKEKQKLAKVLAEIGQLFPHLFLRVDLSGKVTFYNKAVVKILIMTELTFGGNFFIGDPLDRQNLPNSELEDDFGAVAVAGPPAPPRVKMRAAGIRNLSQFMTSPSFAFECKRAERVFSGM